MNSDVDMIRIMIEWLERYCDISKNDLFFRLYLHRPYAHEDCEEWWLKKLHVTPSQFMKTIYKPTQLGVKKRPDYRGCLKVEVRKSKHLLCKMKFWQRMLVEYYVEK